MALILNIETATTMCSVSLAKDGILLALKEQNGDYSHSENLTLFIEDICTRSNTKLIDIDAIAVSKGPGSYTGLRIGVSTAKGLCYSLNKPLIAINTLQQIALGISKNFKFDSEISNKLNTPILFCPMLDARRMEVYCAIYDSNNNEVVTTAAEIIDEHSFTEILTNNSVIFFGDGAAKCKSSLAANKNALFIDAIFPSAKNMISLSESAFNNKQFEDVAYFEPFYLKDFMIGKKKQTK
jgi:tRNA threonylcarbamoyladenosine biosynthesis protein TsaB